MEKLYSKLKTNTLVTFILGLLSLTWLVIDYFVFQTILKEGLTKFSLEWILIVFSAVAFLVFHISVFITLFYSFRVGRKLKNLQKKKENDELKSFKQDEISENNQ